MSVDWPSRAAARARGMANAPMPAVVRGMVLVGAIVAVLVAVQVSAMQEIATEETIAELLATPPVPAEDTMEKRRWAILPQLGYGPDTGPVVGGKFTHRNLAGSGTTLDLDGTAAQEGQYDLTLQAGTPHLLDDRLLFLAEAGFHIDPEREFFGIGNDDLPHDADELSTHEEQRTDVFCTVGWRPSPHLAVDAGIGLRYVSIRRGTRDGDIPFTMDRFPDLPGVDGGYVNPLALALVYTTRDGNVRPTRGWRIVLKVAHTNRAMLSDFEFTRLSADLGYLLPLFGGAHVLGVRLNGGFIFGPPRDIPFWELEPLGGDDTLRGFFPRRFLGTSRVLLNVEYRTRLTEFDFFHVWHVQLDGVLFGEAGRVFTDGAELRDEFELDADLVDRVTSHLRYSYGGGVRFAIAQAIIARVDVAFSEEESGLVYLQFGHTF